jgi:uroporphyrinogen decarboxylase
MTGLERVKAVFEGKTPDRLPVVPIVHSALATIFEVPFKDFYLKADSMADTMIKGYRKFGYDGVQLSLGVVTEAEALGARVDLSPAGMPVLKEWLLDEHSKLNGLKRIDPTSGGRLPMFFDTVEKVVREIGQEAFVIATIRGPLLMASQLRGVEQILIDLIEEPEMASEILEFTTDVSLQVGKWLLGTGAHGLAIGEATCSPNFISPNLYRRTVHGCHKRLAEGLKQAGWGAVGLHICGDTRSIIDDVVATGADFLDIDYQVPAEEAVELAQGRIVLRGNLDPVSVLRFGNVEKVQQETRMLKNAVSNSRWIMSSGCDIPPGTPPENIKAFVDATF